jgi:hypothetical protein
MAEWFIKKITGQDLIDKAFELAMAEETANLIVNALKPELQDIENVAKTQEPIIIKAESSGTGTGQYWQSKRYSEENITVKGSRSFFKVSGVGKIVDAFVNHATSNNFSVELMVDGEKWYSGYYSDLEQTSVADSHLAVYNDLDTGEYFVKFSDINFIQSVEIIVGAGNLTFDVLRVNYEMLV